METPEQKELEKFIHTQLRQLPDREAPGALVNNVLAAVAKRKKLPWWKQSFLYWPKHVQNVLFVVLGSIFAGAAYGAAKASNHLPVPDVSEQLSTFSAFLRAGRLLFEALFSLLTSLPMQWVIGIAALFAVFYGACLAAGFALFRVTAAAGSHA